MRDGRMGHVHEANADSYVIETEQYVASVQVMHRYGDGDPRGEPFSAYFASGINQDWEAQMQIHVKEDLGSKELYISLETEAPTFGFILRGVVCAVFAGVEALNKLTAVGGAVVPWSWGFGEVGGKMAYVHVPLRHA